MDRPVHLANIFDPVSTPAQAIRELSWLVLWICAGIFMVVSGLLVYTLIRFRRRRADDDKPLQVYGSNQIELAWTVIPLLTVFVLFLVTTRTIKTVQNAVPSADTLYVTIVGHQWWWEIRYPALGIVTANELHVPVSDQTQRRPTFLKPESVDVAHSFWVPRLAGKTDVIPNRANQMWSEPREPGIQLGQCAEYCGTQHANMLLWLVLTAGINEYPEPGKLVRRETYVAEYEALIETQGVPFVPKAIGKDLIFSALLRVGILCCSATFGPSGPSGPPDPTQINTAPRPDFYFLSLFALFALLPAYLETFLLLVAPAIAMVLLFALPFLSGTGEKSPQRRPVAVLSVMMIVLIVGVLAYLGTYAPWSPQMDAWSEAPTLIEYVKGRTPLELQGALVLQNKQCRNCHSLGGEGGRRGAALDGVATRLTRAHP